LGNLKVILEAREVKEPEEEELMMQLSPLFLEKLQAAESIGEVKGREHEAQALILRQLNRRLGQISIDLETRIKSLPLAQLEELGEALLDFDRMSDLVAWLDADR
jgi:predicted transposase YdaD